MKRRFFRGLALALAMLMLCGFALAEVRATGDVWMRTGPGRNYDQIVSFAKGHVFQYLGETKMDERPVAWYKVSSGKYTGWVSSKYAVLVNENPAPAATAQPTAAPTAVPTAVPAPTSDDQAGLPALNAGGLFAESLGQAQDTPFQPIQTVEPADLPQAAVELSN
ncbi:MAG: SH3 domain-containing protein [Clostridia bacterium]|nr:SH3 domain-containing protein [Clostridia bacterium]